jgi:glucose-6-phosphate 1-dehydrogenase
MDFCQNCEIGTISPEAYERLLSDVMKDDATLFARWDEVEYSWKFIDQIVSAWKDVKPIFPNYEDKTWGPKAADYLLAKDNHHWINLDLEDEYENI